MFRLSKVACQPKSIKTKRSQTAAGTRVGAIEEESQDANSRGARQEANEDQRKPLGFATCHGHAHLHSTALSLESGGLCQGSSLVLRAATQHLGSSEALTGQQHVGGACHHSQHQQVGAARHGRIFVRGNTRAVWSELRAAALVAYLIGWEWLQSHWTSSSDHPNKHTTLPNKKVEAQISTTLVVSCPFYLVRHKKAMHGQFCCLGACNTISSHLINQHESHQLQHWTVNVYSNPKKVRNVKIDKLLLSPWRITTPETSWKSVSSMDDPIYPVDASSQRTAKWAVFPTLCLNRDRYSQWIMIIPNILGQSSPDFRLYLQKLRWWSP